MTSTVISVCLEMQREYGSLEYGDRLVLISVCLEMQREYGSLEYGDGWC